jgi:ribosomal peptide maturation radical SAM protein 1
MDIVLVNMPFAAIQRPSIALGTLKAILRDAGLTVYTAYANLWYAEYIGLDSYLRIEKTRSQDVLGDWIFGHAAFPDHAPDHDQYLDRLLRANRNLSRGSTDQTVELLYRIRGQSMRFVDEVADRVLALNPKIVGCTSMFQQNVASLALLRRIRQMAPDIITMMGGANCETVMGKTLHERFDWVDYVVSGEADELIGALCKRVLLDGRNIPASEVPFGTLAPSHRLSGYPVLKSGDGVPRAIVQDMRKVPLPEYDDYFTELDNFLYRASVLPSIPIETSRGCWWGAKSHCTFCGLNGGNMSYRSKPAEQAMEEIDALVSRHKIHRLQAVDNILDTHYINSLVPILASRQEKLSVFFEVKSNLKRHQIELFARAGIRTIQPGIESLDTRVLNLMRKGCAAWQNILLLKWSRQYGVEVVWSILHGFPGEADEWHLETAALLPALHHLEAGSINTLRFDRYSPYHNRPADWGLTLKVGRAYQYAYPLEPEALAGIAYFMESSQQTDGCFDEHSPGPGLSALYEAHAAWRRSNQPSGPPPWRLPILAMERHDHGAVVTDTRECALLRTSQLTPLQVSILDAADSAPSFANLISTIVSGHGITSDDANELLRGLLEVRYLVVVDGRAISLVLDYPVPPRLRVIDQPTGYIRRAGALSGLNQALETAFAEQT